jgi:hypothetical protein
MGLLLYQRPYRAMRVDWRYFCGLRYVGLAGREALWGAKKTVSIKVKVLRGRFWADFLRNARTPPKTAPYPRTILMHLGVLICLGTCAPWMDHGLSMHGELSRIFGKSRLLILLSALR